MTRKLDNDIATYNNAKILNVDIKTGNRFMIVTDEGKELTLIGGNYLIEVLPEEDNCPESVRKDYAEKAKITE